jgi:type II secretory pathway pseudopilin PulG
MGFKKLFRLHNSDFRLRGGFTLLELLIIIGIIAILISVAIVAINPARQFAKANNARRTHDLKQVISAIQQNMIDNKGPFLCVAGDIIDAPGEAIMRSPTTTFEVSDPTKPVYDICDCLVPTYLPVMPVDPQRGGYNSCSDYNTEYTISEVASLLLRAPHAQLGETIETVLPGQIIVKTSPTFSLSVSPTSGSVQAGQPTSTTLTATSLEGFNQLVTFSASINPSEPTISISFNPSSCTPTCTSTMQISTLSTTPLGTYSITIIGTDGGFTKQTTFTLSVTPAPAPADFSLSASPTTIKAPQTGTSQTSTITITSLNNFNSAVTLSVSAGLPVGATANFNPNPVTPPANGTITSDFTVSTSNVAAGSYDLTIQGQNGGITKTTTVTLVVVDLSVSLTANPSSGTAPLNDVDLTATVSGSATGTINYKFDCTNDGIWELQVNNSTLNPYTAVDLCNYSTAGTYTAKVRVERDVANPAEGTTTITVTTPPAQLWGSPTCETGTLSGTASGDYAMGYRFTPNVNITVSQLCGRWPFEVAGTRTIRLQDLAYNVLRSASVTSSGAWVCTSITPITLTAGSSYYVNEYGTGYYYQGLLTLPRTCNNVDITHTCNQVGASGGFTAPFCSQGTNRYINGQADIFFSQ